MAAETFNLEWNDFDICTRKTFQNLLSDQDFTDITLACVGNKQIKAHKVILSACSPFFRNLILSNPHQHPLVYLRGVKYSDLLSIIQFIYLGQTQVEQNNFDTFMLTAKELEIKGLITDLNNREKKHQTPEIQEKQEPKEQEDWDRSHFQNPTMDDNAIVVDGDEIESNSQQENEYEGPIYNPFIQSFNFPNTPRGNFQTKRAVSHEKRHACDQCDYRGLTPQHVREHKMSIHEGIKFSCDLCDKVYSHPNNLRTHKKTKH